MKQFSLTTIGALAFAACTAAFAQAYPAKPVRITSPYPTGISPDISARLMAEKLSRYWGQPVIVEPRPGANAFIAFGVVKKAAPDGYDLLLVGDSHLTINPHLFKSLPYDPENDFAPIGLTYRAPFFIWIASNSPYRTVQDLIADAKKDPNKVSYSTPYTGSPPHLGGAMLAQMSGTNMLAVQFKEGPALYTSVANGDVTFTISTIGSATAMLKSGHLKGLAAASPQRSPDLPNLPTVQESGGPAGYEVDTWVGVVAPKGTPADVIGRLSADINRAMAEPDVRERHKALGIQPVTSSPADMANAIRTNLKKNADIVRRAGIQPE